MEEELAERVWFNYNRQMALEVLKNAGSLNFETLCTCMKNRKNLPSGPNYLAFMEHILSKKSLREHYLNFLFNQEAWLYAGFFTKLGITMIDLQTDISNLEDTIATAGIGVVYGHWLAAHGEGVCPNHIRDFGDYLLAHWDGAISEELSEIEDWSELYHNTDLDNLDFECEALDFNYLFSLLNSDNSANLRSTLINQVQGAGISTLQQKKNWLIDWYFNNDPMGSIYLAALRNPSLVSTYQTSPGMLYGASGAVGMENYFNKIKTHFGQSMFDQLVTEFAQQSNLYVDEIKVDEFHLYGSSRLGVYEANKTISRRVARDHNNDNQITNNEYIIETPEEVLYLFSSYQLERGAKRYELANHLGNVLTVISDKKTANFTGTTFTHFTAERISATDYSPYGAPLAGRTWQAQEYRFGFNTQERDDEIAGVGNIMTAQFWEYDCRLGRRWNVDPKPGDWFSSYSTFGNNPNCLVDHNGDYIFGLFGSTKNQRRAAEEFQKKHGGEISNKHSKNISVTYNYAVKQDPTDKNGVLFQLRTVFFGHNGDLRSTEVADYKFVFEIEVNISFGPQIALEGEAFGLKAGADLNIGSVDLINLKGSLKNHSKNEINFIGKTDDSKVLQNSKVRQNFGFGIGLYNLEIGREVDADLSGGGRHKDDHFKAKLGLGAVFGEHEEGLFGNNQSSSSVFSEFGGAIKLGLGLDTKIKIGVKEEKK